MKIILIAACFFVCSCQQSSDSAHIEQNYKVRVIEGCEYIEYESSIKMANNYSYSITHKGNCSNPIHKAK